VEVSALLVEDNPGDATLVEHHLGNPAVERVVGQTTLTHVESLTAAEETLAADRFDVVLLDLGLPESSGVETVRRVDEMGVDAPLIVLTGLDDSDVAIEAISTGAQDFLPKGDLDGDRLARSLRYAIERHENERALARRNEQLDFFNSILRHDMLNGLNVILARAQMVESETEDPDVAEHADEIVKWGTNITELTRKVRSILDSVAEDDEPTLEPVDLAPVVETEAERVRSLTDRVEIGTSVPAETTVRANDLLSDVVGNLLTNAVEHTEEATSVEVSAHENGPTVLLEVTDDGQGVAPDRRAALFDRGEKGNSSSGSGFGLFFVASMVESYGGSVEVTESDRGGAAFVIELPGAK
jgi:signal transduction histidine kinase